MKTFIINIYLLCKRFNKKTNSVGCSFIIIIIFNVPSYIPIILSLNGKFIDNNTYQTSQLPMTMKHKVLDFIHL